METADIKRALVEHFSAKGIDTQEASWKRLSKKKDDQGRPVREFSCPTVGTVLVIEDSAGLIINEAAPSPYGAPFVLPEYSSEQLQAAKRVHKIYIKMAEGEGEYEDFDGDPYDAIRVHPEFAAGLPALGTRLAFMFPMDTYGNDELITGTTLDSQIGELCVSILDPHPDADHDLYAWNMILDELYAVGWDALDEYHLEFKDQTKTVREAVQTLIDLGLEYDFLDAKDKEQGCIFYKELSTLIPKRPKPASASSAARPRT
jgi:hypothetical protein